MRADLDRLMQEANLDAVIVLGDETPNTFRDYLTKRAKAGGIVIKKRGEMPILLVGQMELDEAAKSGLKVMSVNELDFASILRQFQGDRAAARREMFLAIFRKLNISGRVGFYGAVEVTPLIANILALQDSNLPIEIALDQPAITLFDKMYETKDAEEIAALREAGRLTSEVVRRTWQFLSNHYASSDEVGAPVMDEHGKALTIGMVRRYIQSQEQELGLEDHEGFIFAQGRDAGMPHSVGEDTDILQVGRSIVFDIFPKGAQSGYFHDMTRTWCLGRAAPEVQAAYDDVMAIFHKVMETLQVGEPTNKYQKMTLDYFEERGHPTQRSQPGTMNGYVHSLGHGIGLNVHEAPGFGEFSASIIQAGSVFTVEPGLYYPERGYGVRVEDSVYFDESGTLHRLTDFRYDLVVPLKHR
ncbi:MAG: hypothetical protein OHK0023_00930 [Anaerolineae bacterium]